MIKAECPSCGEHVVFHSKPKMGQRSRCTSCDAVLEVVWLDPVELDWPIDEEDEYYDDEEFEDD
ncbi:MAG: lysine biosynthesis protein LysW [Chloroflexota bacterium]